MLVVEYHVKMGYKKNSKWEAFEPITFVSLTNTNNQTIITCITTKKDFKFKFKFCCHSHFLNHWLLPFVLNLVGVVLDLYYFDCCYYC